MQHQESKVKKRKEENKSSATKGVKNEDLHNRAHSQ